MRHVHRNDDFSRYTRLVYTDDEYEEEPMEIKKPDKPSIREWTLKEIKEHCVGMTSQCNGDCPDDAKDNCPFWNMCMKKPNEWYLGEVPQITEDEQVLLWVLYKLGVTMVKKTPYETPCWQDMYGDWMLLPPGALPSIPCGHEFEIKQLLGLDGHATCAKKEVSV